MTDAASDREGSVVNIQWGTELLGRPVADEDGQRIGRISTASMR
jgi:hypothetical protein